MTAPYLPLEEKEKSTADKVIGGIKEVRNVVCIWGILFVVFAIVASVSGDKDGSHGMFHMAFPCVASWAILANFIRGYEKK